MNIINKEMEVSCQALGAAMFMATACLYMAIGVLFAFVNQESFYYHVSFAFLIQSVAVSMSASTVWVLCFGFIKAWGFITRYFLALLILVILFGISMLIPAINSLDGSLLWIISGLISTIAFGTGLAILSEKHLRQTGIRSVLIWEIK